MIGIYIEPGKVFFQFFRINAFLRDLDTFQNTCNICPPEVSGMS